MSEPIYSPIEIEKFVRSIKCKRSSPTFFEKACRWTGSTFPFLRLKSSHELEDLVKTAGLDVNAKDVMALGILSCLILTVSIFGLAALGQFYFSANVIAFILFGWLPGIVAYAVVTAHPKALVSSRQQEEFGPITTNMLILCSSFKHHMHPESALADVAQYGEGKMAHDFREGLRDVLWTTKYSSVEEFLTDYAHHQGESGEAVKRALFDVRRAMAEPNPAKVSADLDKGMSRVMRWVRKTYSDYIKSVSARATYLTMGVAMVIVFVCSLIPVFRMVGWGFQDLRFAGLIMGSLVGVIFITTERMLRGRPSTFAAIPIPEDEPRLPPPGKFKFRERTFPIVPFCVVIAFLVASPTFFYLLGLGESIPVLGSVAYTDMLNILPFFFGLTAGIWLYCYLSSKTRLEVRKENEELTRELPTMLNTLGDKLEEGHPQEAALEETADLMKGSRIEHLLREALANMLGGSMTIYEAFFSKATGALRRVKNRLVRSIIEMYSKISAWSPDAGAKFATGTAEFLTTQADAKEDLREEFSSVFSNLRLVSALLLPLVCGLSVLGMHMLSQSLGKGEAAALTGASFIEVLRPMSAFELNVLTLILAVVCISLFLIFIRFGSHVKSGGDNVELSMDIMANLPLCAIVFTVSLMAVKIITGI